MSSNLPPGVTGREPQIAGYPEGTHNGTCKGYLQTRAQSADLDGVLEALEIIARAGLPVSVERIQRLRAELQEMPEVEVECNFEGLVDAQWDGDRKGNGTIFWTCPRCGTENEESREAGDDHPDL